MRANILEKEIIMSQTASIFRSRWGFHPCSYETFLKLKHLNGLYFRALREAAAWRRWHRKEPHNRVSRPRLRNQAGQVVGYGPPVPVSEPRLSTLFTQFVQVPRFVDRRGGACPDGFFEPEVKLDPPTVVEDYRKARQPAADAAAVAPLSMSPGQIDELFDLTQQGRA